METIISTTAGTDEHRKAETPVICATSIVEKSINMNGLSLTRKFRHVNLHY